MREYHLFLTRRYGQGGRSPTPLQLAEAIAELYHEDLPEMEEASYEEHGAAWLNCVVGDDGPDFNLTVTRGGIVRFEQWADVDYEQELAPAGEMRDVSEAEALQLWTWLAQGQLELVKSQPWRPVLTGEC
jgi:hypothetical protein